MSIVEEARALFSQGKTQDALKLLREASLRVLNAHVDEHCLCAPCTAKSDGTLTHEGERFVIDVVESDGRAFLLWVPSSLPARELERMRARVVRRLSAQLKKKPRRTSDRGLTLYTRRLRS